MSLLFFDEYTPLQVLGPIFDMYDTDKNGKLDPKEFKYLLESLGIMGIEEQEALKMLADENNDGLVSREEFLNWVKHSQVNEIRYNKNKANLLLYAKDMFKTFDSNGDNSISFDEFSQYMKKQDYDNETINQWWLLLDLDKNGSISFQEFWINNQNFTGLDDVEKIKTNHGTKNDTQTQNSTNKNMKNNKLQKENLKINNIEDDYKYQNDKSIKSASSSSPIVETSPIVQKTNSPFIYQEIKEFYSADAIRNGKIKLQLDHKEAYLNDVEFNKIFGMSKDAFYELKPWKQNQLKKKAIVCFKHQREKKLQRGEGLM